MKKIILLAAIISISFIACKKDRTCDCTNSIISETSTEPNFVYVAPAPTTTSVKYYNIKKNNVLAQACVTQEKTSTYNQTVITGTNTATYVVTVKEKDVCELK